MNNKFNRRRGGGEGGESEGGGDRRATYRMNSWMIDSMYVWRERERERERDACKERVGCI